MEKVKKTFGNLLFWESMKFKIIIFVISIALFWSCAYYNTLFNAKKSYNAGIEIIQKEPEKESHPNANKYFQDTIDKCWKLIELYSDQSKYADDALLYIVKSEYHLGSYAQARSHANQFLLKYPDSKLIPEANLWYGKLLLKDNKVEEGKEYLNRIINLSKNSQLKAEAFYELGNLAYENEDYEEAITQFEQALDEKISKQYAAFINFYLGESYFAQRQFKDAINQYKKVEKFSPSLDVEYKTKFHLGKSYIEQGEYNNARNLFRKMLTAPRFKGFIPQIKSEMARILYLEGKQDEAVDLYKEVVKEKITNPGTAEASFSLAKIYEYDILNIDSAVYYYGQVRQLYSRYDSVEVAEDKFYFLSELKKIRDGIKRDRYLIYKLENDSYFLDSLYTLQEEDSILSGLGRSSSKTIDTTTLKIDTTSILYKYSLVQLDSLKKVVTDTFNLTQDDSLKSMLQDSLSKIDSFLIYKAPVVQETIEKRKLPQIKIDYKDNQYYLAEFFLLQIEDYDSAIVHYQNFIQQYEDSILTPKAIYSMAFIYSKPAYSDPPKVDSLENTLIRNYPDSPFSLVLLKQRGLLEEEQESEVSEDQVGYVLFLEAEELYYQNQIDSALSLYKQVADLDSTSIWSAKAQLARAWIYEKDLKEIDTAIQEYTILKENFSQPEFVAIASRKISTPKEPEVETQITSPEDSTSTAIVPTDTAKITPTIVPQEKPSEMPDDKLRAIPSVSKTPEFRVWRMQRSKKR
jgi:TolA-binding protein